MVSPDGGRTAVTFILDLGRAPRLLTLASEKIVVDAGIQFPRRAALWHGDKIVGWVTADPKNARRAAGQFGVNADSRTAETLAGDGILRFWRPIIYPAEKPMQTISGREAIKLVGASRIPEDTLQYLGSQRVAVPVYAGIPLNGVSLTPVRFDSIKADVLPGLDSKRGPANAQSALRIYAAVRACEILGTIAPLQTLNKTAQTLIPRGVRTFEELGQWFEEHGGRYSINP